jgi:hypothetical protein
MGDPIKLPPMGGNANDAQGMSREQFAQWVEQLGRHKTYKKTPFVDPFGNKTTFQETMKHTREAMEAAQGSYEKGAKKLTDPEVMQRLRNMLAPQS